VTSVTRLPDAPQPTRDPVDIAVDACSRFATHLQLLADQLQHHRLRPARPAGPRPRAYRPYLQLCRTDPGYEGEVAPFNPRDWLEVHPAPSGELPAVQRD
jgi:hypothetical protein